ncbi:MAG: alkaline phosphatase D family protein [Proteobacteria bacterium]|nr:alkaline phosphatase D family protein [Pseudomonadota bacterium]
MTLHTSRRTLLTGLGATALVAPAIAKGLVSWKGNPFSLGVAAGAPAADGFVLWTRLAPEPLAEDGGIAGPSRAIGYEIATDDSMHHIVQRGTALAESEWGYSVHKSIKGLKPGRPYWYRFTSGSASSAIGRAQTLPPHGADKLRFAYFSCSHYEYGYFSAYRHAAYEDPDFGIFLGDYIYEYAEKHPDKHPTVRTHSGGKECETLAEYRARYTQYRLDPNLQFLHQMVPALLTWDDHEVQNDYADKWGEDFQDPAAFLKRRAAAYKAYYEFMPLKPVFSQPHGPNMRLYDRYDFGDLMRLDLIDGRQYRSREACYDHQKAIGQRGGGHVETRGSCPELFEADRSMIGMKQEKWLFDGLATSKARWNVVGNDVTMARLRQKNKDGELGWYTDGWDGYPASRARLMQHVADSKPSNFVAITGDIHSYWANDLKTDFDDPKAPTIGSELIGTSITSYGVPYDVFAQILPDNPHIKFFESRKRGYVSVELTRERMTAKFQTVSDVTDPAATLSTLKTFVVDDGNPGPVEA